ncbi:MAG: hypothetical protein KDK11_14710 [Maritimibacter sp.]|nr:hypothetical protein [Maritimibacter sp.]
MTDRHQPDNPNAAHFEKPYFLPRPMMRKQSQSERTRATQSRLAKVKPAKITLPPLPAALRE